jgi:methylated-DNA-[protein]-cysteine S-methyltransferase
MTLDFPIGPLSIATDDRGRLTQIHFVTGSSGFLGVPRSSSEELDPETLRGTRGTPRNRGTPPEPPVVTQLREYFAGARKTFDVELAPKGTPFQLDVWKALCEIPYGDTISYAELARRIGRPAAVRAVGAANGANPIPVIVPCHRVIGSNGTLTGYGGGIERKQFLLTLEGRRLF